MQNLIFSILILSSALARAEVPANYQSLTAQQKLQILWSNISAKPYAEAPSLLNGGGPSLRQLFFSGIGNAFTSPTDEIAPTRSKVIHKWGSAVQVAFVPSDAHPFTGIFRDGAVGVARLSLALPYGPGMDFVPGMAVKFLIDGQPSKNITVMERLEGQAETNYFKSVFTNILPDPTTTSTKAGTWIFESFVADAIHLDVKHVAAVSSSGTPVASPRAPYQLIFKPMITLKSDAPDFRRELATVPAGTVIYEVYGKETSAKGSAVYKIGHLQTTSAFVASQFEDEVLYFQHAGTELKSGYILRWLHAPYL